MGAAGRCIGRTDLAVDPRRAKRLAHRIRALARREGLARVVWTSPLARARDVGRWLRRWGWRHRVDTRLCELDFGRWDGRPWQDIDRAEIDAWAADLALATPHGGESQAALQGRVRAFVGALEAEAAIGGGTLVVGHAGWIIALRSLDTMLDAAAWPTPPRFGELVRA
jgi:alpha-ribazole phosphatase